MEALKAQAEGQPSVSSVQAVHTVLSQNTKNSTFLKNIGMAPISPTKSATSKEKALQEELAAERQSKAALHDEVNVLKQKSQETEEALQRTQREMQEYKKALDENNLLLRRMLVLNSGKHPVLQFDQVLFGCEHMHAAIFCL
jgi:septal ring factor EnvC (AmiA/AmiB activator)